MKKYLLTIVLALITGILLSKVFFNQYSDKKSLKTVFEKVKLYILHVKEYIHL